jgi:hypothetical protein
MLLVGPQRINCRLARLWFLTYEFANLESGTLIWKLPQWLALGELTHVGWRSR